MIKVLTTSKKQSSVTLFVICLNYIQVLLLIYKKNLTKYHLVIPQLYISFNNI